MWIVSSLASATRDRPLPSALTTPPAKRQLNNTLMSALQHPVEAALPVMLVRYVRWFAFLMPESSIVQYSSTIRKTAFNNLDWLAAFPKLKKQGM
jgi:hypothetical protein